MVMSERTAQILNLLNQGLLPATVATKLDIPPAQVYNAANRWRKKGVKTPQMFKWQHNTTPTPQLIEMYDDGLSYRQIADLVGMTPRTVEARLRRAGIDATRRGRMTFEWWRDRLEQLREPVASVDGQHQGTGERAGVLGVEVPARQLAVPAGQHLGAGSAEDGHAEGAHRGVGADRSRVHMR